MSEAHERGLDVGEFQLRLGVCLDNLRPVLIARHGVEIGGELHADVSRHAWEHRDRLAVMDNPAGYLYRVAQSQARRYRRWRRVCDLPPERPSSDLTPTSAVSLERALARLTPDERTVVVLVHDRRHAWSMLIRRETDDVDDIDAVHRAAFASSGSDPEPPEVQLVHRLRADVGWVPALSLVAEDPTGAVVGHVVCTVGSIEQATALGLGPLGVLPSHQRRGVGQALMHSVLGAADALGFAVVVLLGHVGYYSRFGFVPGRNIGVIPPEPSWDEHFQARALHTWNPGFAGTFRYVAPFEDL